MLFKNATIYTMEEDPFIGDFRVNKGVFTEIGKNLDPKMKMFKILQDSMYIQAW